MVTIHGDENDKEKIDIITELCKKGRKADHAHYCQHCDKYKPRARVIYKNQKKVKLEKRGVLKEL